MQDVSDLELSPTSTKCQGGSLRLRSLVASDAGLDVAILAQLQFKLFGVAGTTVIDTLAPSNYRLLLEHYNDPINQQLPPYSSPVSGSSGMVMVVMSMPSNFPTSSSGQDASISTSSSAGVQMIATLPVVEPSGLATGTVTPVQLGAFEESVLLEFALSNPRLVPSATQLLQPGVVSPAQ